jgi:hypothetical protein
VRSVKCKAQSVPVTAPALQNDLPHTMDLHPKLPLPRKMTFHDVGRDLHFVTT